MTIHYLAYFEWLVVVQSELLLFAGIFFLIGFIDEFIVDLYWLWLRLTGQRKSDKLDGEEWAVAPLAGDAAIFIPAWNESAVIGDTIAHTLAAWPQEQLRLYVGIYKNDAETLSAAMKAAGGDPRLRLVVHDRNGPSTKADCLNRLFVALQSDERRYRRLARMVVFHDAEDMVDPAALALLDRGIDEADFVQLPVLPMPQNKSPFLGSHYCEEFAEAHGKAMVVRNALGAALPGAGVGCAIAREALEQLASRSDSGEPFNAASLTEDYELGIELAHFDARWSFIRRRHGNGELVATRAYFPARLDTIVRQKTRWIHGIALQGWDQLGWTGGNTPKLTEVWMRLRDRRSPLTALVLLTGYVLLGLSAVGFAASYLGAGDTLALTPFVQGLLLVNFGAFVWRAVMRFAFTAREFGVGEGLLAIVRIPITNVIAIMAGRRALTAYVRTLYGQAITWEKTPHTMHPARELRTPEPV